MLMLTTHNWLFTSDGGEIGDFATALFAFKGQLPTLLEEELALLRGRDDFMAPGSKLTQYIIDYFGIIQEVLILAR